MSYNTLDPGLHDPRRPDSLVGQILNGRYRVIELIGKGGMGAIYRVEHLLMKKELACKIILPQLGADETVSRRFEREAEAAARLDHPNIITITDFGPTGDGQLFMVMELLSGPSLTQLLSSGPLPAPRALEITRQVLAALGHAHKSGVVHRDLKPDNIILTDRDGKEHVKLLDFGIAKITFGDRADESITEAGMVFGTPEYLSPEQATGDPVDGRADLYATGIILFEMLAGRRPFESESKVKVISMHVTHPIPRLRETAPTLAANLVEVGRWEKVIDRALAKERDTRFADAAEFSAALDALAAVDLSQAVTLDGGRRPDANVELSVGHAETAMAMPEWTESWQQHGWRRGLLRAVSPAVRLWRFAIRWVRKSGLPWPRALVGGSAALVAALLVLLVVALFAPSRHRALLNVQLDHIQALLVHGQLDDARTQLNALVVVHPESARVQLLLGNLAINDGDRQRALARYRDALRLDHSYRTNPVLLANVTSLLDRHFEGPMALELLAKEIGEPALPEIVECAKLCKEETVRRQAIDAAARLGAPRITEGEAAEADSDGAALIKLRSGRSCKERKGAAQVLIDSGDRRFIEPLRAARDRQGGFMGLEDINGCMKRDIDEALRRFDGTPVKDGK